MTTILIGNAGAIAQSSLKRMLAWSGRGTGRLPAGGRGGGHRAGRCRPPCFYLAAYLLMNVAAFAVVIARERVSEHGDDLRSLTRPRAAPARRWHGR